MTNTGMLPLMAVRAVLEAEAGFMIHLTSSVKSLEEAAEVVASLKIYLVAEDAIPMALSVALICATTSKFPLRKPALAAKKRSQ